MANLALTEVNENYLETILELQKEHTVARSKDIADHLGVNRGSVTAALKALRDKGLIHYEPYSFITLTPSGKRIALEIARKHRVLKDFLLNVLSIDSEIAEETACRMEHAIDGHTMERLVCFLEYIRKCPRAGEDWIQSFLRYCASDGETAPNCEMCIRNEFGEMAKTPKGDG
jgi:DtxR family transcriptional regulator, Mn-dependent transcriptional regulator